MTGNGSSIIHYYPLLWTVVCIAAVALVSATEVLSGKPIQVDIYPLAVRSFQLICLDGK